MKLQDVFKMVEEKKLVLPDFQREYVWNREQQKELLASLLLFLPIGSFLLLSGEKDDFASKSLGFPTRDADPKDECKFLLDGQQRFTTLKNALSDLFSSENWENDVRDVYPKLKYRWLLEIKSNKSNEEDVFGWSNLYFDQTTLKKQEASCIEERLYCEKIGVSLTGKWLNPGYTPVDDNGGKLEKLTQASTLNFKGKEAAKLGVIPLYSLYGDGRKMLYEYAIDHMGDERRKELQGECDGNEEQIIKILRVVDEEIELFIEDEERVNNAWFKLASNWKSDVTNYLKTLLNQEVDIIDLPSEEITRAVVIFERINKGGTSLDNFDLIVAKAARDKDQESLNKRIITYLNQTISLPDSMCCSIVGSKPVTFLCSNMGTVEDNEIASLIKKQYLNLLSIFSYTEYGEVSSIKIDYMKKDKILNLRYDIINEKTQLVIDAIKRACAFLQYRCGIVKISELHYTLMILPLAYLLRDDRVWESKEKLDKLEFWYWASILSGEYRYGQNERSFRDLQNLYKWIIMGENGGYENLQNKILNVEDFSDKDILLRKNKKEDIPIVIHNTILQYILSMQPCDFIHDQNLSAWDVAAKKTFCHEGKQIKFELHDHHIIPLKEASNIGESTKVLRTDKTNILNSILNRTYILADTNLMLSDYAPSRYFSKISEQKVNTKSMLVSHYILGNYSEVYNNGKYEDILEKRFEAIQGSIIGELSMLLKSKD